MSKLDWSNIFNSSHKLHGHVTIAIAVAKSAGYPYYAWNGYIYRTEDNARKGNYDSKGSIDIDTSDMTEEFSSGYTGYRCNKCGTWEYAAHVVDHKCP